MVTKLLLWIGAPSAATFLVSAYLENIHFFFFLSVAALLVAILPRLSESRIER